MDVWISSLIAILQLTKLSTIAAWDPKSPLILIETPPFSPNVFPSVVMVVQQRESNTTYLVYHTTENENNLVVNPFCGNPYAEHPYCNSAVPFYPSQYQLHWRPTAICHHEPEYDIVQPSDNMGNNETCHHNDIGHIYQFVYKLCQPNIELETVIIYKACYNQNDMQIIFGSYTIQNPSLLRNMILADEQNHQFSFDFSHIPPNFNQYIPLLVNRIYEENREYTPKAVLPPELLPFGHQKKPFYHYINMAAMQNDSVPGWDLMIQFLRFKLSRFEHAINVTAGLLEVMTKKGKVMYLYNSDNYSQVPIAKRWWVLIYNDDKTLGLVIIMNNAHLSSKLKIRNTYYNSELCSMEICSTVNFSEILTHRRIYSYDIYCCYPRVITEAYHLDGGDGLLHLPNVS